MPQISVIIPIYNKIEIVYECIRLNMVHCVLSSVEWILIDNGCDANTKAGISKLRNTAQLKNHECKVIVNDSNFGVAKAWNQGISQANGHILLILNNDCVLMPVWDKILVEFVLKHPNNMISPLVVEPEWFRSDYTLHDFLGSSFDYSKILKINKNRVIQTYFGGVAIASQKQNFEKIGSFDENFWLLLEDYDYLLRAHALGIKSVITCSVVGYHFTSTTRKDMVQTFKKNHDYFEKKWHWNFETIDNNFYNKTHRSLKKLLFKWFGWYHQSIKLPNS